MADKTDEPPADIRRQVPSTTVLLGDPRLSEASARLGRPLVKAAVGTAQQLVREGRIGPGDAVHAALAALPAHTGGLRPVHNATGVVLHTNLGRAPLSRSALEAMAAAGGYTDVELDLNTGRRAPRGRGAMAALREAVPAAEAVHVVNNGAAALALAAVTLAPGRDILLSRGEFVEIGDGFRIPELLVSCGARIREVGTTNRTRLGDYADAAGPDTGFILKVHPSNFTVSGFTGEWKRRNWRRWACPSSSTSAPASSPPTRCSRTSPTRPRPCAPGPHWSPPAGTSCSAGRRPGWSSAWLPSWNGCAAIRWPGPCAWTSSPWPRWMRHCAVPSLPCTQPCTCRCRSCASARCAWPRTLPAEVWTPASYPTRRWSGRRCARDRSAVLCAQPPRRPGRVPAHR